MVRTPFMRRNCPVTGLMAKTNLSLDLTTHSRTEATLQSTHHRLPRESLRRTLGSKAHPPNSGSGWEYCPESYCAGSTPLTPSAALRTTVSAAVARSGAKSTAHTRRSLTSPLRFRPAIFRALCFAGAAPLLSPRLHATAADSLLSSFRSLGLKLPGTGALASLACLRFGEGYGFDSSSTRAMLRLGRLP